MPERAFVDTPSRSAIDGARAALNAYLLDGHPAKIGLFETAAAAPFARIRPEEARAIAWDLINLAELAESAQEAP